MTGQPSLFGCSACGGRGEVNGVRCPQCGGTGDQAHYLARTSDPVTSQLAAYQVDLRLTDRHKQLLAWLRDHRPATDDEMAVASVRLGLCARHEQGRRLARTMREAHGLIVPYLLPTGQQMTARNQSGRLALCWDAAP